MKTLKGQYEESGEKLPIQILENGRWIDTLYPLFLENRCYRIKPDISDTERWRLRK